MEDLIIIGAGPIGIYASTLAALHNLSGLVFESLDDAGGQLTELYPEKDIIDLPGLEKITARDFIGRLLGQRDSLARRLPIRFHERVTDLDIGESGTSVRTANGIYQAKTVLLTTGMGVFTPRRAGLAAEENYSNIYYAVKSTSAFRDRRVVILGGGDSAVDWALNLSQVAAEVRLVHRRSEFRAQAFNVDRLTEYGVKVYKPYTLVSLDGNGQTATALKIRNNLDQSEEVLDFDALLVNYGTVVVPASFPLETSNGGFTVDRFQQTSLSLIHI